MAASVLAACLYAAKQARHDILRAVNKLMLDIHTWVAECDNRLYRLVCYVHSSLRYRMIGWVEVPNSPSLGTIGHINMFTDADLLRCGRTQRSTTGVHLEIAGPVAKFGA